MCNAFGHFYDDHQYVPVVALDETVEVVAIAKARAAMEALSWLIENGFEPDARDIAQWAQGEISARRVARSS